MDNEFKIYVRIFLHNNYHRKIYVKIIIGGFHNKRTKKSEVLTSVLHFLYVVRLN